MLSDQKPDVMYADIGGMDIQKQEVREAVELPLTHFELYKQVRSFKSDLLMWSSNFLGGLFWFISQKWSNTCITIDLWEIETVEGQ